MERKKYEFYELIVILMPSCQKYSLSVTNDIHLTTLSERIRNSIHCRE